jgi:hypothetical protein
VATFNVRVVLIVAAFVLSAICFPAFAETSLLRCDPKDSVHIVGDGTLRKDWYAHTALGVEYRFIIDRLGWFDLAAAKSN